MVGTTDFTSAVVICWEGTSAWLEEVVEVASAVDMEGGAVMTSRSRLMEEVFGVMSSSGRKSNLESAC